MRQLTSPPSRRRPRPRQTSVSRRWIAERLRVGSVSYGSDLLPSVDSKL